MLELIDSEKQMVLRKREISCPNFSLVLSVLMSQVCHSVQAGIILICYEENPPGYFYSKTEPKITYAHYLT